MHGAIAQKMPVSLDIVKTDERCVHHSFINYTFPAETFCCPQADLAAKKRRNLRRRA